MFSFSKKALNHKVLIQITLCVGFFLFNTQAWAQNVEVRSLDELQKEIDIILQSPAIQKTLSHKEVKSVLGGIQAHLDALERQAKFEAEKALKAKKNEAQALAQDRWDTTVGKLIQDYKKSDIPRKLEQGDWSALEETKALLQALPLPEELTPDQTPHYKAP